MRMKGFENTPCIVTMEGGNINGASSPVTDLKYSPDHADAVASNGILSPPTTPSATTPVDNDYTSPSTGSGRFKFFKDGKFIMELWHHKNGERMYWIPVSKSTTCWPTTVNCTSRQESSTSLSVSDDNLSIQSSPWQRDHTWKQNIPRKNINSELEFSMRILRSLRKLYFSPISKRKKRRRPYEVIKLEDETINGDADDRSAGARAQMPKQKSGLISRVHKKCSLTEIVQTLWDRKAPCENMVSSCRTDPGIVSPRKRILKEMEKVTLEELRNINKKHRTRVVTSCCPSINPATSSVSAHTANVSNSNGSNCSSKQISSHSINSILAKEEEPSAAPSVLRNLLGSPSTENSYESSNRSSYGNESPLSSADVRTATAVNHSQCSTPVTSPVLSYPQPVPAYPVPAATSYMYHSVPPYLSSITNHHPYYSVLSSNGYPGLPAAVWGFRSLSSLPTSSLYPSPSLSSYTAFSAAASWIPLAHSSFPNYTTTTDNGTDVPLNLSKHPC